MSFFFVVIFLSFYVFSFLNVLFGVSFYRDITLCLRVVPFLSLFLFLSLSLSLSLFLSLPLPLSLPLRVRHQTARSPGPILLPMPGTDSLVALRRANCAIGGVLRRGEGQVHILRLPQPARHLVDGVVPSQLRASRRFVRRALLGQGTRAERRERARHTCVPAARSTLAIRRARGSCPGPYSRME